MSTPPPRAAVVVGTRGSALARAQTDRVCALLAAAWPGLHCEVRPIVTRGDRTQATGEPLPAIGGKGLFTAELEQALRDGAIDLAVHSLKDLPTEETPGIAVGAVCLRDDVRDCLVSGNGGTLDELPAGAVVGTSSLRRAAQLRALRPDLEIRSIRGNVDTRIRKVRDGEYDAALLAAAGIARLGLESEVAQWIAPQTMLPAPGQGALAVQCRADDADVLALLGAIDDAASRAATGAERAFLRALEAGCTAPVAAYASVEEGGLRLEGLVASPDGREVVRVTGSGAGEELGARLAEEARSAGAERILRAIRERGPLHGRRIVVTRPAGRADGLVGALAARGASVLVRPLIAIEEGDRAALDSALRNPASYGWIVFTSVSAVEAAAPSLRGKLAGVRIAAVGPATADALRALGAEPAFVPERFAAEELAAGLEPAEGERVLLPQAGIADTALADELRRRGAIPVVVAAYRTVPVELADDELAALGDADAVVVASGSAVRSLASHVARAPELARPTLVCIGPKTAGVAREVGLSVGLVADEATADGIVRALESHFTQ